MDYPWRECLSTSVNFSCQGDAPLRVDIDMSAELGAHSGVADTVTHRHGGQPGGASGAACRGSPVALPGRALNSFHLFAAAWGRRQGGRRTGAGGGADACGAAALLRRHGRRSSIPGALHAPVPSQPCPCTSGEAGCGPCMCYASIPGGHLFLILRSAARLSGIIAGAAAFQ